MAPKFRFLLLFVVALVFTWVIYWPIYRIAREKNIVDNPDSRKLHRVPVPVLGGAAVFFGIVLGLGFFKTMLSFTSLFAVLTAMIVMLYVGIIDDIIKLPPLLRLAIEIIAMTLMIYGTHYSMCNFQGLWGIKLLPTIFSVPLSVFIMVGIINAINMIDGVDGMVSGFCIVACSLFGLVFFLAHEYSFAALAAVSVGALIPFFLHNVFGRESKMYIGDGGTMMMGTVLSAMVAALCKYRIDYPWFIDVQFGLIAFCIAVLSVPVFDTLRVMIYRMAHGKSPFKPDKNHLHHIFIELGFSHIGTTMTEIVLDLFVVAVWAAVWRSGASVSVQFYVTVAASILVTFVLAALLKTALRKQGKFYRALRFLAEATYVDRKGIWFKIQRLVDGNWRKGDNSSAGGAILVVVALISIMSLQGCGHEVDPGQNNVPDDYSVNKNATCIAIFGDLQEYSQENYLAAYYQNSLQWLKARQLKDSSIACILHPGDVTNNNYGHQWRRFRKNTDSVSACIPFYSSTGNHDYTWDSNLKIFDRRSTYLNNYFDFPLPLKNVVATFEPYKLENAVYENYLGGREMYVMFLEFAPRPEVLDWASSWLENNNHPVILATHEYLDVDGTLVTENTHADKHFQGTGLKYSKPVDVWEKVVFPHDNVRCVICGHVRSFVSYRETANAAGRAVPQIQFNLQDEANGGGGWIMLWNLKEYALKVDISLYNTVTSEYRDGQNIWRTIDIF